MDSILERALDGEPGAKAPKPEKALDITLINCSLLWVR